MKLTILIFLFSFTQLVAQNDSIKAAKIDKFVYGIESKYNDNIKSFKIGIDSVNLNVTKYTH